MSTLTIGQLAKQAEVNVETIRFYEREGLLVAPARLPSGYRQYDKAAVERVKFIRRAQRLGFTLKDAKDLLDLKADPEADRHEVREKATKKVGDIDQKIRELHAMREELTRLIAECHGEGPALHCPIITAISGEDDGV